MKWFDQQGMETLDRKNMNKDELMDIATGYWKSAALSAAVDLNIFGGLTKGLDTVEALSQSLDVSPLHTEILLNALCSLGILEKKNNAYTICKGLKDVLDPDAPHSLINALRFNIDLYPVWGNLAACVKQKDPARSFDMLSDPDRINRFVYGMHSRALSMADAILPLIDKGNPASLLDVASGPGTFSVMLATKNPGLRVTFFDLPSILNVTKNLHKECSESDRITYVEGDYHDDPIPQGFDAILYSGALHQEKIPSGKRIIKPWIRQLNVGFLCECFGGKRLQKNAGAPAGCVEAFL